MNIGQGYAVLKLDAVEHGVKQYGGRFAFRPNFVATVAIEARLGIGYEVEFKNPYIKPFKQIVRFIMEPFGDQDIQDVNVPMIGRLRAKRSEGRIDFVLLPM